MPLPAGPGAFGLYSNDEFSVYVKADVPAAASDLLRTLVTGLISEATGLDFDDPSTPVTSTVKSIALGAAARAYLNPAGVTSRTETITDFSETERWSADGLGVYLTDAERARLLPPEPASAAWSGTVSMRGCR